MTNRTAPFAALLGLTGPRKPRRSAKQPQQRPKSEKPKPTKAVSNAPRFSHLRPSLSAAETSSPQQRAAARGDAARAAVAAYEKATNQGAASNREPKRGSAAAHAVALYHRLNGR